MKSHNERDADLLDEQDTPAARYAVDDLRRTYAASMPPRLRAATTRAVYQRLAERQRIGATARRSHWPAVMSSRTRIVLGGALAAVLLTGATVYAALPLLTPLVDQALRSSGADSGSNQIAVRNLGQQVNLVQSACGYTMTVTRVYADDNRVIIGYTVQVPAWRADPIALLTLTDASGRSLPRFEEFGVSRAGSGQAPAAWGNYAAFDASSLAGDSVLSLRLTARLHAFERLDHPLPADVPCETYPPVIHGSLTRGVAVNQPLWFDLQAPVDPRARVAAPRQSVEANGLPLALDRIVVTPAETRLSLRVPPSLQDMLYYTLVVDGRSYGDVYPTDSRVNAAGAVTDVPLRSASLNVSLYDARGDWTILVHSNDPRHSAPWTFHLAGASLLDVDATRATTGTPEATTAVPISSATALSGTPTVPPLPTQTGTAAPVVSPTMVEAATVTPTPSTPSTVVAATPMGTSAPSSQPGGAPTPTAVNS